MTTCTAHMPTPLGVCLLCGIPIAHGTRPPSSTKPRRGGISQQSAKRAAGKAERDEVREAVERRDRQCLVCKAGLRGLGRRRGPGTYHHLQKSSAGGKYTEANGVWLCAGHNDGVENHPDRALEVGLVITARNGEVVTALEAKRRRRQFGLVP